MYCGDETGSFIGELTSSSCRFGYGGEDCPKSVLSSYMYRDGTIPSSTHQIPPDQQDIIPIFATNSLSSSSDSNHNPLALDPDHYLVKDGIIENWDAWENAWHRAFRELNVATRDKHTRGITKVKTPILYSVSTAASGMKSSTVSSSNDNLFDGEIMHPILAIDSGHSSLEDVSINTGGSGGIGSQYQYSIARKQKGKMVEIMYESLRAPATFIAPSPMLAAFGNGRQTALVVDIGANGTRVTPIVDGMVLQQAQRRTGRGGDYLSAVQEHVLRNKVCKKSTIPRYIVKAKKRDKLDNSDFHSFMSKLKIGGFDHVQDSIFHQMALRDVMYEMKTGPHMEGVTLYRHNEWTIPFLREDLGYEEEGDIDADDTLMDVDVDIENGQERKGGQSSNNNSTQKNFYELPDGTIVNLQNKYAKDLKRLPELLFALELPFVSRPDNEGSDICSRHSTFSSLPLHELVKESLTAVADADVRKELCGNIVLTGAASLCTNIESRMSLEIQYLVPKMYRCKVIASRNTIERKYGSWIGGSVLSSLGSFQQLWLSRKEYEEYGMTLATQRFP